MAATVDSTSAARPRPRRRRLAARYVVEWRLMAFRRLWRSSMLTSFLQPMMFVAGMGLGVGALVNRNASSAASLGGVKYIAFLAPGLLATTAMRVGGEESMWPVLGNFKWKGTFHAIVASPVQPSDIAIGQALFIALRCLLATTTVSLALALFPDTRSSGLLLAVPFSIVSGLAFGMPIVAFSATRERDSSFAAMSRFVITPLFLFGGAFYPLKQLPRVLQLVAEFFPLWHGVELSRAATLHHLQFASVIEHLAYLAVWLVVGLLLTIHTFTKRLSV